MLTLANYQISIALKVVRERCSFSAEELESLAGLPQNAVTSIESGEMGLDYLTAARLTNVMRVGLAEIAVTSFSLDPLLVQEKHRQMVERFREPRP